MSTGMNIRTIINFIQGGKENEYSGGYQTGAGYTAD
jgi:hypothetical protein